MNNNMLERIIGVSEKQESFISPMTPTPDHILYLSELDLMAATYISGVHVYQSDCEEGESKKNPVNALKDALAKVLVYYYPLAGRLTEASHGGRLELNCNGEGALFAEAEANCTLEDVCFLSQPYYPFEESSLFAHFEVCQSILHLPLLSIQVTLFKCGGFALGIKWSHIVMDGEGFSQFMRAFGETTKSGEWVHSTLPLPVWERERLLPRQPPQVDPKQHDEELVPLELLMETFKSRNHMSPFVFQCSAESIGILKARAVEESKGQLSYCSTFEALTAFIWKTYVQIMKVDTGFIFSVNLRKAMGNVLSVGGYYGNCMVDCSVAAEQLIGEQGRDLNLWDVVRLVRKTKDRVNTEEYVRGLIDFMKLKDMGEKKLAPKSFLSVQMVFNDYSKFAYIPDLGIGRGRCFIMPSPFLYPIALFLPTTREETHSYILIALPDEVMQSFKERVQDIMLLK